MTKNKRCHLFISNVIFCELWTRLENEVNNQISQ